VENALGVAAHAGQRTPKGEELLRRRDRLAAANLSQLVQAREGKLIDVAPHGTSLLGTEVRQRQSGGMATVGEMVGDLLEQDFGIDGLRAC